MKYTTIYNDPYRRSGVSEAWCYWDDVFSKADLEDIVQYCDSCKLDKGTVFTETDRQELDKIRISDVGFHYRNGITGWIFDKCNFIIQNANEKFFNFNLNGYDSFQYTTYNSEENGKYDWHMDMRIGGDPILEHRKLSMTLLLNDDFEGGNFQISLGDNNNPITLPAKKGRALLFPSYMIHRVTPVTKGIRKSLVVWCTGPKFT